MEPKDERSDTANPFVQVPTFTRNLILGSCLLAIGIYMIFRSLEPYGILHTLMIWYSPHINRLLGLRSEPYNTTESIDVCSVLDPYPPLPARRTSFGGRATIVYGWPSTGGVWVHSDCYSVELDFLGLSRFEISATQRFSEAEDEFCKRLEWIGAHFYESENDYHSHDLDDDETGFWYGWPGAVPGGGVWALWTERSDASKLGVSRINNARTMEERCKAIEMVGGKFYQNWEHVAGNESLRLKPADNIDSPRIAAA